MPIRRPHRKVLIGWLAAGSWGLAVQLVRGEIGGLGIRPVVRRPMLDLYLGPLTVSVGRVPWVTDEMDRHRGSCRGFLFADEAVL